MNTQPFINSLYELITTFSDIAIGLINTLGEIFHLIVFEELTLGGFINLFLPSELNWIGTIASALIPIPILFFVLTGVGLYYAVAFVKWLVGIFT